MSAAQPALNREAAFGALLQRLEPWDANAPFATGMPQTLRQIFDADFSHALSCCERQVLANVTCLRPNVRAKVDGTRLFDTDLLAFQSLHTVPGRQCHDGHCSDACSRVTWDGLASADECTSLIEQAQKFMLPLEMEEGSREQGGTATLSVASKTGDARTALMILRLIERLRRAVAHEYGVPLHALSTHTAFVNRIVAGDAQPNYRTLHADESSNGSYHYSAVLYLRSVGDGFEGGDFVFLDPDGRAPDGRGDDCSLLRLPPMQGRAVLFSSGWENAHFVDEVDSGVRWALPAFFTTDANAAGYGSPRHEPAEEVCAMLMDEPKPLLAGRWHLGLGQSSTS